MEEEREGLPEAEFSALLESVSRAAPLLKGFLGQGHEQETRGEKGGRDPAGRREALLLALKPYLSPARRDAVDYLVRLARVGDAIRALQ